MNITLVQKYSSKILIRIETEYLCVQIPVTIIFEPFDELYVWLGKIRDRQLPAIIIIEYEGYGLTLFAESKDDRNIEFIIRERTFENIYQAATYLKTTCTANSLIQSFYDGITDFVKEKCTVQNYWLSILNNINWASLLKQPDRVQNWDMRLAMYGGGTMRVAETGINTVQTTLQQQELYNLRNLLYYISVHGDKKISELAYLSRNLPVDIALCEIDSDWYQKRRQEIEDESKVYDSRIRKKEERERLFELRQARLKTLKLGQLVDGTVIAFKPYGLHIDLGGYYGLLYISWVSQIPVEDLSKIFQLRGWVRGIITYLDVEKGRVGISTKELESQPGDMLKDPILVYQNAEAMIQKYRSDNNL